MTNLNASVAKMPPHNIETEKAMLGAVLTRPDLFPDLSGMLGGPGAIDCFYDWKHQYVWQACVNVSEREGSPDLVTVNEELGRMGVGEKVGVVYLADLASGVASPEGYSGQWAQELKKWKKKRDAIKLGQALISSGFDPSSDPEEQAVEAQQALDVILDDRVRVRSQNPADFIHEWLDYTEKLKEFSESQIKSPFYGLNSLVGGLFPGEEIILAGRPGMGKTALALNIVEYALKKGHSCGVFSLEMTRFALTNRFCTSGRLLGSGRGMDAQKFRTGDFDDNDWNHILEFAAAMKDQRLRIWDRSGVKPSEVRSQARAWKREMEGLDLVVIDYLQLVEPESKGASREQEVGGISRMFKKIALELEIPVLVLCQLSRAAESSKKPLLSHLRESGAIEQDADGVWFLWPKRSNKNDEDAEEEEAAEVDLIVAKGRGNRVGTVPLLYLKKYLQFVNPAQG